MQILHIAPLVQLTLPKYIGEMLGDNGTLAAKQSAHLVLSQPYSLTFQPDLDSHAAACCLVDLDTAIRWGWHMRIFLKKCLSTFVLLSLSFVQTDDRS